MFKHFARLGALALLGVMVFAFWQEAANSQLLRRDRPLLRRRPPLAATQPAEAVVGVPFGAGYARFELPANADLSIFTHRDFTLVEKNGRVFYTAYDHEPVKNALREALNLKQTILGKPFTVTIHYLFTGNEPLELTLYTPTPQSLTVTPQDNPQLHEDRLHDWWDQYGKAAKRAFSNGEYPQVADMYLLMTLSRRLNLEPPREGLIQSFLSNDGAESILGTLLGTESIRLAMQKETLLSTANNIEPTDQSLPPAVQPPPLKYPPPDPNVAIEPLAMHVPHECLYVRFGNFANFMWMQDAMQEWGGDLRNLMAFRGVNYDLNERMQKQLAVKQGALAKVLGPSVIADVALIGQDTFMREGAGIGILFQAKNNFALSTDLNGHRRDALKANPDAKDETVEIAGKKVSFLHTPDNRIRSFYVVDGDFHLVTTSRRIAERFIGSGKGEGSLGSSEEFQVARTRMPLTRDDTVFAYLSDEFFRTMTGPAFRVEMTRRMQSVVEMDNWQLAKLMAKNEALSDLSVESLVQNGYLSPTFNIRPDGSKLVMTAAGKVTDTLRGGKGSFIPVGDVAVELVTAAEVRAYGDFARHYTQIWTRMDPVTAGIKRYAMPAPVVNDPNAAAADPNIVAPPPVPGINAGPRERIVIDLHIMPIPQQQMGFIMQFLGNPTQQRAAPVPGDLFSLEVYMKGIFVAPQNGQSTHTIVGLRDIAVPWEVQQNDGIIGQIIAPLRQSDIQLYGAAWPYPGILGYLGAKTEIAYDAEGFADLGVANAFGIPGQTVWQRVAGTLTVLSWRREVINDIIRQFQIVETERPAQIWLHVSDVANAQARDFLNAQGYMRARQITSGNLRLMHLLNTQYGLPFGEARKSAEELVQGKLLDPLGGQYELAVDPGMLPVWRSTAWNGETGKLLTKVPPEFVSPPLGWFRGLDAEVMILPTELNGRIEVEMQRSGKQPEPPPAAANAPALPFFNWPKMTPVEKPAEKLNGKEGANKALPPSVKVPTKGAPQLEELPAPAPEKPRRVPPPPPKPE